VRITAGNLRLYGNPASHQGRLILTAWQLGNHPHPDFQALRRWAHMLGYRGHFATKSRRYSTTMRALRAARRAWHRRQHPLATHEGSDETVVTITDLEWAGRGWRTTGDAVLALSATARAREHRPIGRKETSAARPAPHCGPATSAVVPGRRPTKMPGSRPSTFTICVTRATRSLRRQAPTCGN
jgi:hypothetical protein